MSIYRISSNTIIDNGVFNIKNREYMMDKVNDQLSTGQKHRLPREGVVDVTQSMTFHSKILKIDQYLKNIQNAEGERSLSEIKMMDTINVIQRIRELAVQGANGVYSAEERKSMAFEVDQLLKNIITDANSKYKDNFLFSGFKKYTQPFEIINGAVRGSNEEMVTQVKYLGDNGKHLREIDTGEYLNATSPGSEVFWAEQFQIYSKINTADFRLTKDSSILVDKTRIDLNAGDNVYAIIDKINKSPASINASIDVLTGGLILKSTKPHKFELSDIEGSTLLQDLGVLENGQPIGPDNIRQDAIVFGGSVFDVVIGLRNSMLTNNTEDIGGRYLGAIDYAINNIMTSIAESGAKNNRMTNLAERLSQDKISYTDSMSQLSDVDVVESIANLKMLEFAHNVSLGSLARLSQKSLMDYL